jgi:hypothetical protein
VKRGHGLRIDPEAPGRSQLGMPGEHHLCVTPLLRP